GSVLPTRAPERETMRTQIFLHSHRTHSVLLFRLCPVLHRKFFVGRIDDEAWTFRKTDPLLVLFKAVVGARRLRTVVTPQVWFSIRCPPDRRSSGCRCLFRFSLRVPRMRIARKIAGSFFGLGLAGVFGNTLHFFLPVNRHADLPGPSE